MAKTETFILPIMFIIHCLYLEKAINRECIAINIFLYWFRYDVSIHRRVCI